MLEVRIGLVPVNCAFMYGNSSPGREYAWEFLARSRHSKILIRFTFLLSEKCAFRLYSAICINVCFHFFLITWKGEVWDQKVEQRPSSASIWLQHVATFRVQPRLFIAMFLSLLSGPLTVPGPLVPTPWSPWYFRVRYATGALGSDQVFHVPPRSLHTSPLLCLLPRSKPLAQVFCLDESFLASWRPGTENCLLSDSRSALNELTRCGNQTSS